jgi:PAS domain S-box-containing protein
VSVPMHHNDSSKTRSSLLASHFMILVSAWTIVVGSLMVFDVLQIRHTILEMASNEACAYFNKDQSFRLWAALHGGVYVPVNERTQPNPYLSHIPERDIMTPSGKPFTLMNPAYMLRQIMEEYSDLYGVRGHITSLKPFRTETAPDEWEESALLSFERGAEERLEFALINGSPHLRLMRPMFVTEECLKCHNKQGYKVGDVRGGVSVSLPMNQFLVNQRRETTIHIVSFTCMWLLGVVGVGVARSALLRRMKERDNAEQALQRAHDELELRIAQRTSQLREANESLREEIAERKLAEGALKKEHDFITAVLETADALVVVLDSQGRIVSYNRACERATGYTFAEVKDRRFWDFLLAPEQAAIVRAAFEALRLGRLPGKAENYWIARDGRHHLIAWSNTVLLNAAGQIEYVIGTGLDITEARRVEEELRKYREHLESLVEERTARLTEANERLQAEIAERKQAQAALLKSEKQLRLLSTQLLIAQEEERARVAREIHDSTGQSLAAIKFGIERALTELHRSELAKAANSLESIIPVVIDSLEDTRNLYMGLRPSILDDLGIIAAISWFSREYQQAHPNIQIVQKLEIKEKEIPQRLRIVIFRVIQEALDHVAKHSQAHLVNLSVLKTGDALELNIADDGLGFDVQDDDPARDLGYARIKERIEYTGGTLSIEAVKGEGTTICAVWPPK